MNKDIASPPGGHVKSGFPRGGGELGALIRTFDWSQTSIGPIAGWPQSLKTVTDMLLRSPVPIVLLWGEDGVMIYNDAYAVFAGNRHPALLGARVREGWVEVADFNDNVMRVGLAGGTLSFKEQELALERRGQLEPVWMDLDYSPIFDETGAAAGVIAIVVEVTEKVQANRRLRESEERFRALTAATSDVVYRMNADWSQMHELDGRGILSDTESSSIAWRESYLFPEDWMQFSVAIDRAIAGKTAFELEHRIRQADGASGWVLSRAIPVFDEQGGILEWFGTATDVTARRQAAARRETLLELAAEIQKCDDPSDIGYAASRLLGRALDASRVGYGTIDPYEDSLTVDRDWTVPGAKSLVGDHDLRPYGTLSGDLKRGMLVSIADVAKDPRTAAVAEELKGRATCSFVNVPIIDHGAAVSVFIVNSDRIRNWTPDELGLIREVAAWTRAAMERRRIERAYQTLAHSLEVQIEERTRERDRVWQNSQDISVVIDSEGRFVAVNPAATKILGWSEAEMVGRPLLDFVLLEDVAESADALDRAGREVLPSFLSRYQVKSGGVRWISWVAAPDRDLIYASGRDVTAEKEAAAALEASEDALRQSQKMEAVGQLTGGLAHDFNNILAGISGSLDLMKARLAQGRASDVDRYLIAAQGATKRAAALTHRLLAFSRRQTLDPKPTNINRLVSGMEDLIRRSMGPAIAVETVASGGLWNTLVDAGQLENALLNLSLNARDAMTHGGRLTVETGNRWLDQRSAAEYDLPAGQYVTLSVTDNGSGMSPEVAARAFDPFFTTKPLGEGTGLGLSMIYGFARQSGGQAKIYTEMSKGTTVCLYLPRHIGEADAADMPAAEAALPRAAAGQTVMVVDDEPLVRMLVTEVLEELGYTALEAEDAPSALKVLHGAGRLDLLITDVGLPNGMNGRQLAEAVREMRPDLSVLFITGYAENAILNHGHLAPGMHAMTKPFAMDTLAARIKDLVGD